MYIFWGIIILFSVWGISDRIDKTNELLRELLEEVKKLR